MKQLTVALMLVVGALLAAGGVAQAYPPGSGTITVSTPTPDPGAEFTVTFHNCKVGEEVVFVFNGGTPVTVISTGDAETGIGSATVTFTAPTVSGTYTGTATCGGVTLTFEVSVTVPDTSIPQTGSDDVGRKVSTAAALLALGTGLLLVSRRRRRTPATA
jgi:LPXTG-motif cell wall-anchored protein